MVNYPGLDGYRIKPGSLGKPVPGTRMAVLDPEGQELPPRQSGEISLLKKGKWFPLKDRGYTDAEGYFYIEGRSDDVIISAGYRIGPFEVESALVSHPAVAEAAAVAAPDEERGSVVRAVVVLREGHEPTQALVRELQEHAQAQTAPYKYPRIVDFTDALPKTASGKIRRALLRGSG